MKIPNLNLLRKIKRPGAQPKPERTHYGIKFNLPETLTEKELFDTLVGIPSSVYKLSDNQGMVFDFGGRECSRRLVLNMLQSIVWEKGLISSRPPGCAQQNPCRRSTTLPSTKLSLRSSVPQNSVWSTRP